ncbi:(4Fe-4S)-binding protein [Pseudonocardia pini]|uniref:(4Fe-4S)-binding protein n=1 Tax=Pseudonocardia pini TaxID=2758030 RepID=UPI0015F02975|nr:(4Fe-4S)-binding protein [Pseudonocardia pini]
MTRSTERTVDGLTVRVDHELCSGAGVCRDRLGEVYELVESRAWIRDDAEFEGRRADLDMTETACPWFAIEVTTA